MPLIAWRQGNRENFYSVGPTQIIIEHRDKYRQSLYIDTYSDVARKGGGGVVAPTAPPPPPLVTSLDAYTRIRFRAIRFAVDRLCFFFFVRRLSPF